MKYFVTDMAGKMVAGVKNPGTGKPIELTEAQAEHPLRLGHITSAAPEGGTKSSREAPTTDMTSGEAAAAGRPASRPASGRKLT